MKNTGVVDLPLHSGKCPRWLFPLMKDLSGKIAEAVVDEYGSEEFLRRISDPYWFQALGCAIGFDWHSSGLTTTTTGALKAALDEIDIGIKVAGGKGLTSRKTPEQVSEIGEKIGLVGSRVKDLVRASRLSAKVDNSLLQDGYKLYHHSFFVTKKGWAIVQQGMNDTKYARRYHWIFDDVKSFVREPHKAIVSDRIGRPLNLTADESEETRKCSVDLINENPSYLKKYLNVNKKGQTKLFQFSGLDRTLSFSMSERHFPPINADMKSLIKAYETKPGSYEDLVLVRGMGSKNLRALALISNLVHGSELSWRDPVKYSFAHGGKDGWPYPVNRKVFRESIEFLDSALKEAKVDQKQKMKALRRLGSFKQSFLMS